MHSAPAVYVPLAPDGTESTAMLAVNLHAEGCALWKPGFTLPLQPGQLLRRADVQLDDARFFVADLRVLHVTPRRGDQAGTQAGCVWETMSAGARHTLAAWLARQAAPQGLVPGLLADL